MVIEIKDTNKAKEDAASILSNDVKLDSALESIEYILKRLNEYWAENNDQHSFADGLTKDSERLRAIYDYNKEFANALTDYVAQIEKVGANS